MLNGHNVTCSKFEKKKNQNKNFIQNYYFEKNEEFFDSKIVPELLFMNKINQAYSEMLKIPGEDPNLLFSLKKNRNSYIYQKKLSRKNSIYLQLFQNKLLKFES